MAHNDKRPETLAKKALSREPSRFNGQAELASGSNGRFDQQQAY
jgi:hypothetical protein